MGDILFFFNDVNSNWPLHSMIFIGDGFGLKYDDMVIYHTGPDVARKEKGFLKILRLEELNKHIDPRWHINKNNKYFLGFYRWKILD